MKKKRWKDLLFYAGLSLCTLIMVYPILYMLLGSVCTPKEFAESGILPVPTAFTLSRLGNFLLIFQAEQIWASTLFTLGRTVYYCVVVLFTSMLLGYVFAKFQFRGKRAVFLYFMISMMVPGVATVVPTYILFARFPLVGGNNLLGIGGSGFIDKPAVMFITGIFGIYNVFLVRQAIVGLGDEYREAAEVDGAGLLRIIFFIYMPMLLPVLIVILVGMGIGMWNDYFFSKMYAYGDVIKPIGYYITEVLAQYQQTTSIYKEYPAILAVSTAFSVPPVVFYLCLQKYLTQGMAIGGIKG